MRLLLVFASLLLVLTGTVAQTPQKTDPASKLIQFQMALLKRGPKWTASPEKDAANIQQQHVAYVISMLESGKAVCAGPVKDDEELVGIYIFRTQSPEEARGWADGDPAVGAGHVIVEMHPWWSEDVMKKASTPLRLETAYLAFLTRGDKWTPEKTPATEELQKAHLANINRLAEMKKLVVAGPFGDNGKLRGIFVFRVDTLEEAKSLANSDPAVKAGRLALDIHPWLVPAGILP